MLQRIGGISCFSLIGGTALLAWTLLVPGHAMAQGEESEEKYRAFGVALSQGMSGVLDITVSRWTTEEERAALLQSLIENGQEKTVEMLRKQPEAGWARTQGGRGMGGQPRSILRYAYQFNDQGKRTVVLMTDRTMRLGEVANSTRSSDYDISTIVMQLAKEGDEEKGEGVFYFAVQLGFDKEKNTLTAEYFGTQPIRLTSITRTQ